MTICRYNIVTIFKKLWQIIILLSVSIALLSCRKEQVIVLPDNVPISFESPIDMTKALIDDIDKLTTFKIYGYFTTDGSESTEVFNATEVNKSTNGQGEIVWAYEPIQYWLPGAKYSFAAFHPSNSSVSISNSSLDETGEFENLTFTYTHQNGDDDFMMAEVSTSTVEAETNNYTVSLPFKHLLSNININVKAESSEYTIVVLGYSFSGMSSTALFTNGSWSTKSGYISFDNILDESKTLTSEYYSLLGPEGVTCIPETKEAGALTLSIYCKVIIGETETQKLYQLKFPEINWEQSKKYTYTATLGVDYFIQFSNPTVESWNDERASGTIIIK